MDFKKISIFSVGAEGMASEGLGTYGVIEMIDHRVGINSNTNEGKVA